MPGDRLQNILRLLVEADDGSSPTHRLCDIAAEVTGLSGAGIMLLAGELPQGSLCTSDPVAARLEDLQYTLGEGPCVDAHRYGTAILEPDLLAPQRPRWPAFASLAADAGARAVFGFPVRVGAARLGALNLYRAQRGPLGDDHHADALVMADVAARAILNIQAEAPPGVLAEDIEAEANLHLVVHQAAGMASEQLGVSMAEALVRLRARAFRTNQIIADVALDVVNRRFRFVAPPP